MVGERNICGYVGPGDVPESRLLLGKIGGLPSGKGAAAGDLGESLEPTSTSRIWPVRRSALSAAADKLLPDTAPISRAAGVRERTPARLSAVHDARPCAVSEITRMKPLVRRARDRKRCAQRLVQGAATGLHSPRFPCFQCKTCDAPLSGHVLRSSVPPGARKRRFWAHAPLDLPCCCEHTSGTPDAPAAARAHPAGVPPVVCAKSSWWHTRPGSPKRSVEVCFRGRC